MNALTLLSSDTNTRLPHCAKKPFSPHLSSKFPCQAALPCGYVFHLALVPCTCPPPAGGSFHSSWAPASSPPSRHPSCPAVALTPCVRLPSSGNTFFILLGLWLHNPCMEALFPLLRFQLSVPAILHTNALYTLLGLQHLALSCPFTLDAFLHGHSLHCAEASTPFGGDVLAWAPVPCVRPPFLLDTLALLGLKHPMLGYISMEMPSPFLLGSHTLHWDTLPCCQSHPA